MTFYILDHLKDNQNQINWSKDLTVFMFRISKIKEPLNTILTPNPFEVVKQKNVRTKMDVAKELRKRAVQVLCLWIYNINIPCNVIKV